MVEVASRMYATCPNCRTVFAVTAAELRRGHGEVRCGACLLVFDAVQNLSDEPSGGGPDAVPGAQTSDAPPELQPAVEPKSQLADSTDTEQSSLGLAGTSEPSLPDVSADFSADANIDSVASVAAKSSEQIGDRTLIKLKPENPKLDQSPSLDTAGAASVKAPEDLENDKPVHESDAINFGLSDTPSARDARSNLVATIGMGIGAILLCLVLAAQYVWFNPGDAIARYPQAASEVAWFCATAGCELPPPRAPEKIALLTREVQAHPKFEGALLVSIAFRNTASFQQAYPGLRFTLYDVNSEQLASRAFSPAQYLGRPVSDKELLPAGQQVQATLEVLGPEEAALSFEFAFF